MNNSFHIFNFKNLFVHFFLYFIYHARSIPNPNGTICTDCVGVSGLIFHPLHNIFYTLVLIGQHKINVIDVMELI